MLSRASHTLLTETDSNPSNTVAVTVIHAKGGLTV